jgi:hypothetical protein
MLGAFCTVGYLGGRKGWGTASFQGAGKAGRRTLAALLFRQRVGADLEMDYLAGGAFAAFYVPDYALVVAGPDAAAFPSGGGVIDAAIHGTRV